MLIATSTAAARTALLAALLLLALAVPAARADSIAYIKDGNVWLSTPDGARQFQVTTRGGYTDVSQADDGTMIAVNGVRLHRLDRYGNVVADFVTPVSDTRPAPDKTFYGPFDPAISPDGTKVAYTYYYITQGQTNGCYPPQCYTTINEGGTGYSHGDRETDWDEAGFQKHSGWRHPIWVDNQTTVLSDPTHLPNDDVVVDQPASRDGSFMVNGWFSDTNGGNTHLSGGDISRDKTKMAFATGDNDATLTVYRVATFPTTFKDGEADASTRPDVCYRYSGPSGGQFGTPTFSPDGTHLAVAEGDGIHVVAVPGFAGGCTTDGASPTTGAAVIPGATEPDWGPADVPAARPTGTTGGGATGSPGPGTTPTPVTTPAGHGAGSLAITVRGSRLTTALRRGLRVAVTGAEARARLTARATVERSVVGTGSATATAGGTATVTVRFTARAAKRMRHARRVVVTVTLANARARATLVR